MDVERINSSNKEYNLDSEKYLLYTIWIHPNGLAEV